MKDVTGQLASKLPDGWIESTDFVDYRHPDVQAFAARALTGMEGTTDTEKAVCLFNAVRDTIRYDPYQIGFDPDTYKASHIAQLTAAFCVPKAILLAACLRSVGIAAGVGFADVKNHLNSPKLADLMETDMFHYHGYVALKIDGKVFKVTPTFNKDLCERFGVQPIEFDGTADALFHEYDAQKRQHMEYVKDRGIFEDPPMADVLDDLGQIYSKLKSIAEGAGRPEHDPDFAA